MNKVLPDAASEEVVEMDNSSESSTEQSQTEETQSDGGEKNNQTKKQVPFHEDPKVQEYLSRQMEAREQKLREEFEGKFKTPATQDKVEIPAWFGGDEASWNAYQAHLEARDEKVRQKALQEFQGLTQKEQKLIQEANDWFESNVKEIEGEENIAVDRNLLLKTAQDFELVDSKGRWNWKAAHRIAKAQYKADPTKVDQRKKVVDISGSDRGGSAGGKEFKTQEDFRKSKPW